MLETLQKYQKHILMFSLQKSYKMVYLHRMKTSVFLGLHFKFTLTVVFIN